MLHHSHECDFTQRPFGKSVVLEGASNLLDRHHFSAVFVLGSTESPHTLDERFGYDSDLHIAYQTIP
jgi:hypothetical protein